MVVAVTGADRSSTQDDNLRIPPAFRRHPCDGCGRPSSTLPWARCDGLFPSVHCDSGRRREPGFGRHAGRRSNETATYGHAVPSHSERGAQCQRHPTWRGRPARSIAPVGPQQHPPRVVVGPTACQGNRRARTAEARRLVRGRSRAPSPSGGVVAVHEQLVARHGGERAGSGSRRDGSPGCRRGRRPRRRRGHRRTPPGWRAGARWRHRDDLHLERGVLLPLHMSSEYQSGASAAWATTAATVNSRPGTGTAQSAASAGSKWSAAQLGRGSHVVARHGATLSSASLVETSAEKGPAATGGRGRSALAPRQRPPRQTCEPAAHGRGSRCATSENGPFGPARPIGRGCFTSDGSRRTAPTSRATAVSSTARPSTSAARESAGWS